MEWSASSMMVLPSVIRGVLSPMQQENHAEWYILGYKNRYPV